MILYEHLDFSTFVMEKNNMDVLKKNKIDITDEERQQCMSKKAVWNHGPNGEESPAVWKSKNEDGSFTYITNTHRAYATADSIDGAINLYHNKIKGTS